MRLNSLLSADQCVYFYTNQIKTEQLYLTVAFGQIVYKK